MLMNPGVTVSPVASMVRGALPGRRGAMATIRSPVIATSPTNGAAPLPSTMVPFRMRTS